MHGRIYLYAIQQLHCWSQWANHSPQKYSKEGTPREIQTPKEYALYFLYWLHDSETRDFVIQGLADLGVAVFITGKTLSKSPLIKSVHDFDTEFLEWCDFLVSDSHTSPARITACILAGIIPVVPKNTPFKWMFSQFDPMQFTGNSFVYDGGQYQIFASVVALLENMKFPADREILLKNVVKTL